MKTDAAVYYLDESGNTGDLVLPRAYPSFAGQPGFALAAIRVNDDSELNRIGRKILNRSPQISELKAKQLKRRPDLVSAVLYAVLEEEAPFFAEYVDKKYYLCTLIVNCHILPPTAGLTETEELNIVRRAFADHLYRRAPDAVFLAFSSACLSPSNTTLRASLDLVRRSGAEFSSVCPVAAGVEEMTAETIDDYERRLGSDSDIFRAFLPVPDLSKRDKEIWALPHYSSLTNIYARINTYHGSDFSGVTLVHDEQHHFDEILVSAMRAAEGLKDIHHPKYASGANYRFAAQANIEFRKSEESFGLQAADLLAGFVRSVFDKLSNARPINAQESKILTSLLEAADPSRGIGINHVVFSGAIV